MSDFDLPKRLLTICVGFIKHVDFSKFSTEKKKNASVLVVSASCCSKLAGVLTLCDFFLKNSLQLGLGEWNKWVTRV